MATAEWNRLPRVFQDQRVFIVGGGPSARLVDWELLRHKPVLACNAAAFLLPTGVAPWAIFGDKPFLRVFREQLCLYVTYGGTLINATGRPIRPEDHWMLHIRRMNRAKNWGIILDDPETSDSTLVAWNKSTGGCAINVAVTMGAVELVLIGFDMKANGDSRNWHQAYDPEYDKKDRIMPKPTLDHFEKTLARPFPVIAEALKNLNILCWNTCSDSSIKDFPHRPLEVFL